MTIADMLLLLLLIIILTKVIIILFQLFCMFHGITILSYGMFVIFEK